MSVPDVRLSLHHVGARAGSRYFPVRDAIEPDVVNVLYEADPRCVEEIEQVNRPLASELHVLPYCLAAERGSARLTVTADPYATSIYEPNPEYAGFLLGSGPADYVLGEALRPVETTTLETTTLDDVVRERAEIPPPDFLSANIQGAEYDLLVGATAALRTRTVGVVLETEFHPLYKGQKVFGDIAALLSAHGFHFVRFASLVELAPLRTPRGLRGPGFHAYGYAVFLRKLTNIAELQDPDERYVMMQKLALVSLVYDQMEYALDALGRCARTPARAQTRAAIAKTGYGRLLLELDQQAAQMPRDFPPSFAELGAAPVQAPEVPATGRRRATAQRFAVAIRRLRTPPPAPAPVDSPVEAVLRRYRFDSLADALAARR